MYFFKILGDGTYLIDVFILIVYFNSVKEDPSFFIIIWTELKLFFFFFFSPQLNQFQLIF